MSIFTKQSHTNLATAPAWGTQRAQQQWGSPPPVVKPVEVSADEARRRMQSVVRSARGELLSLVQVERRQMAEEIEARLRGEMEQMVKREVAAALARERKSRKGGSKGGAQKG